MKAVFSQINLRMKKNGVKGFTLVELLITIALLGIITVPVGAALIMGLRIFDNELAIDDVFQTQQDAFIEIKESLRENPYDVTVTTTVNGVLQLSVGAGNQNRIYYLDQDHLMRQMGGNASVVARQINVFAIDQIQRDSTNAVIGFTITLTATERNRDNTLTSSIALRRY